MFMQPSHAASRHFNRAASVKVIAILIVIAGMCPCSAGGTRIATTTTTLSVSPGEVTAGTAVTLTATVTADGAPFARGRVVFCDANAARCNDSAIFGQAQLTTAGTATIRLTLGVGTYSIVSEIPGLKLCSGQRIGAAAADS